LDERSDQVGGARLKAFLPLCNEVEFINAFSKILGERIDHPRVPHQNIYV